MLSVRRIKSLSRSELEGRLHPGQPSSLTATVELLLREKRWAQVLQLAERFSDGFVAEASLTYAWAQALRESGDPDRSAKVAERAYSMHPGEHDQHWSIARILESRGERDWAEREYQYLIENERQNHRVASGYSLFGMFRLSELLHARGKHLKAATFLADAEKAIKERPESQRFLGNEPNWLPTRKHVFMAAHHKQLGDATAQTQALLSALALSPHDADVLIELYRLEDPGDEVREQTMKQLGAAIEHFHDEMLATPEDSTGYNQYAWLVGNTEGDLDEALKASRTSLQLRPGTAGYLDTLGRVHYTRGEYLEAVQVQQQAVALEPNSQPLVAQLELFRAARERQLNAAPGDELPESKNDN